MRHLSKLHLAVGLAGVLVFVLTGQYMRIFLDTLSGMPDGPRMLYRSSHLYLMWASLLNLALGCHFLPAKGRGARNGQLFASALLLIAPALMLWSFFGESETPDLNRMLAYFGNIAGLAGMLLHTLFHALDRIDQRSGSTTTAVP